MDGGRTGLEPWRLVRTVIIHDQMHVQFGGHRRFNGAQKLQKYVAAMPPMPMTSPVGYPAQQTRKWRPGACSRAYAVGERQAPRAGSVACDRAPESGSFHRQTLTHDTSKLSLADARATHVGDKLSSDISLLHWKYDGPRNRY